MKIMVYGGNYGDFYSQDNERREYSTEDSNYDNLPRAARHQIMMEKWAKESLKNPELQGGCKAPY